MEERESSTIGALIPPEGKLLTLFPPLPTQISAIINEELKVSPTEADKDLMCPICMQMITDAFLTACDKSDCPCCGSHLTNDQLFPNFLLNKLLKKASVRQAPKNASTVEQFRRSLLQVVNELDAHCPVVEISTLSKLKCLSWNKYTKNHIASSDYEGIITVWDVTTRQSVIEYEEHEKRAWSVDFSCTEPSMLVSDSDDGKVKVWCIKQETSVLNIDMKANVCCVKYNPGSNYHIAVGSADHHIHYYDLRIVSQPVHVFGGHHRFGSPDVDDADDDVGADFISAVCLKNDSPTLLTANSQGTIKVLVLAA